MLGYRIQYSHRKSPGVKKPAGCRVSRVLLLVSLLPPPAFAQAEDLFLGYAWGTTFDVMSHRLNLRPSARDTSSEQYASNLDRIGSAEVAECDFEFSDGKFSGVIIYCRGRTNSQALVALFKEAFGEGQKRDPGNFIWSTSTTRITYDEDSEGNSYVYWYSPHYQRPAPPPPLRRREDH